ncbi:hypothetical protein LCGC14_2774600, partial [marine sediment metagenome]
FLLNVGNVSFGELLEVEENSYTKEEMLVVLSMVTVLLYMVRRVIIPGYKIG